MDYQTDEYDPEAYCEPCTRGEYCLWCLECETCYELLAGCQCDEVAFQARWHMLTGCYGDIDNDILERMREGNERTPANWKE